eukprot:293267-Chlamydomonas_euryale.AAC.4
MDSALLCHVFRVKQWLGWPCTLGAPQMPCRDGPVACLGPIIHAPCGVRHMHANVHMEPNSRCLLSGSTAHLLM